MDPDEIEDAAARTWTDAAGREHRWADMSDDHLRNTAAMLRRLADERVRTAELALRFAHSDAATQACEDTLATEELRREDDGVEADAMEAYLAARSGR